MKALGGACPQFLPLVPMPMVCNFVPTQIAELSLRETVENQPLQFEVAMHGQHKTYKFQVCMCVGVSMRVCFSVCPSVPSSISCHLPSKQACSIAIRDMWAQEIRRLLQDQFTLMKSRTLLSFSSLSFLSSLSSPNLLTSPPSLAASLAFPSPLLFPPLSLQTR